LAQVIFNSVRSYFQTTLSQLPVVFIEVVKVNKVFRVLEDNARQVILIEGQGSVQFTSLYQLVRPAAFHTEIFFPQLLKEPILTGAAALIPPLPRSFSLAR
jgi:hypothetical protein